MQDETAAPSATEEVKTEPVVEQATEVVQETAEEKEGKAIAEMKRRIGQLVFQREEEKRRAEQIAKERDEIRRQYEEFTRPKEEQIPSDPAELKAYIDRQVQSRAKQEAELEITRRQMLDEQQKFDLACNAIYERGIKEYGDDFGNTAKSLQKLGIMSPTSPILHAIIRLDNGHQVLKNLADNPEQVIDLLDKPPVEQILALAKMQGGKAPVKTSTAPPPLKPISAASGEAIPQPDASGNFPDQAAYRRWREAQKK